MLLNRVYRGVALNLLELQNLPSRLMPLTPVMNFPHLYLNLLSILQPEQHVLNEVVGFQQSKHLQVRLKFPRLFEESDVPRALVGNFHHRLKLRRLQ